MILRMKNLFFDSLALQKTLKKSGHSNENGRFFLFSEYSTVNVVLVFAAVQNDLQ